MFSYFFVCKVTRGRRWKLILLLSTLSVSFITLLQLPTYILLTSYQATKPFHNSPYFSLTPLLTHTSPNLSYLASFPFFYWHAFPINRHNSRFCTLAHLWKAINLSHRAIANLQTTASKPFSPQAKMCRKKERHAAFFVYLHL